MLTFYNSQYIVIIGHEFDDAPHQHFMKHILIALEGTAKCMIAGNEVESRGILIQSSVQHQVYESNQDMLLFLIPDCSDFGRYIEMKYLSGESYYILTEVIMKQLIQLWSEKSIDNTTEKQWKEIFQSTFACFSYNMNKSYIRDERVLEAMKFISSSIENGSLRRKEIAAHVSVSPDRLSHIMKEETGMTIRDYILLCKIKKAIELMMNGNSITCACMQAGFSSSSHFADTIRKCFGLSAKRTMDYMKGKIISI